MPQNKEQIVIIGYGWVGQANALSLSMSGYDVSYFDPGDPAQHYVSTYKHGYENITKLSSPLERDSENTWYIVSVGDKVSEDGVQDISLIKKALDSLRGAKGKVILRSTVLPHLLETLEFDLYVPEFLHEKYAVEECLHPYLFVVGSRLPLELPAFLKDWEKYDALPDAVRHPYPDRVFKLALHSM